ncbi:3'-5' exonuclease [Micromonospora sp. RL09-050-HVF-A]|uniref:3'-5' exonuclease n=1 Tax=Micromonospora sp. RL09-050-HVF-A TaxID=1703433 RepID=UPI001C5FA4D6|nr:3'-5' exonuclease [Micromonospora sp. RL09-050-HVF-A]MBW4700362.1 3'-5' exonuclease [Micromonospora sp. RL09-050-HVF-A]
MSENDVAAEPAAVPKTRARKESKPKPPPADFGPVQVLRHTGLAGWQWDAGTAAGLIPAADVGGRWSAAVADQVAARRDEIVAAVGAEAPIGGHRAAERLAGRTGLDVEKWDVEALADAGVLAVAGWYKEFPLWDCRALDAVDVDQLGAVVAERQAWIAASVSKWDAPSYLRWSRAEFDRVAKERGLRLGRQDRYATADLDVLSADEDLVEQVRVDRELMTHQAALHLEIRETDFKYLVAADLAVPCRWTWVPVTQYRSVSVPLYRVGDLEALREHPAIDWEAVWSVRRGEPSPLRELARRPVDRAAVIRRGMAELGGRYGIEVWAWWHAGAGRWEVDFERREDSPTVGEFRKAITAHPYLREHQDEIAVATHAGAAIRWARAMREPGAAVILDTETTGLAGYAVEIAVVDACTGETLLDTLVAPGCEVEPEARWVHGISDAELADAPPLAEVLPKLLEVTAGRTVLAYNAEFDHAVLGRHTGRDGLDPSHLGDIDRWACLMIRRSDWEMRRRWLPLGGGHRALGDCQTAYDLLRTMVAPARQPKAMVRR